MSESEILFSFLIGLIIVALGTIVMSLLQWQRIHQERDIATRMRRLRGKNQPQVTVMVYAKNNQSEITSTLRSLKNNSYRAFDVVVVDDVSNDSTSAMVKDFMAKYPNAPIRLLRRRNVTTMKQALQAGYSKSERGSKVLVVMPGLPIDKQLIKRAVASQNDRMVMKVSVRESLDETLRIEAIGTFLARYFWQVSPSVTIYDASWFKRNKPDMTVEKRWNLAREFIEIILLLLLLIAVFTATDMQVIWYAWIVVTMYGIVAVWLRYGEPLRDRIILTASVPLALFLIPATSAVRAASLLTQR